VALVLKVKVTLMAEKEYDADSVKVLRGLEPVWTRNKHQRYDL